MNPPDRAVRRRASRLARRILSALRCGVHAPPLKGVAVEINAACTRRCGYCPNCDRPRPEAYLEEGLFRAIVGELKGMGYRGRFGFNLYNEPLLDPRLPAFIAHVRKELPGAFVLLDTNGDLLDRTMWRALIDAGLDFANVTQHDGTISPSVREIMASAGPGGARRLHVQTSVDVNNRAGLVRTPPAPAATMGRVCPRPFSQLCVTHQGKGVLCCNDYLGAVTLGDARRDTVAAMWNGPVLRRYRLRLLLGGRARLALCGKCDVARDLFDSPLWPGGASDR